MEFVEEGRCETSDDTVGRIVGWEIGQTSRMMIPRIRFSFEPKAWYTHKGFIDKIADRLPRRLRPLGKRFPERSGSAHYPD